MEAKSIVAELKKDMKYSRNKSSETPSFIRKNPHPDKDFCVSRIGKRPLVFVVDDKFKDLKLELLN